jgi:hypothetical protein
MVHLPNADSNMFSIKQKYVTEMKYVLQRVDICDPKSGFSGQPDKDIMH